MPEKMKAKVICPKCKTNWATLKFSFDSVLTMKDISVKPEYRERVHFVNNEIVCPVCQYPFRIFDVYEMIAKQLPQIEKTVSIPTNKKRR